MASLTGRQVGGYLIEEELGRGAMGVVFKAKQLSMDRHVALKFLPKRLAQDEKLVQRFLREARAAGQLSHPNIVSVHDAGVIEGLHFIAMEFVNGNSVQKRVEQKGPYSEKETLDIIQQVAEALKVAHTRGILHRDIKPDNFLIDTEGRVRLADLGLARFQNKSEAELTQDGQAMGTPHYMSPEQCKGQEVDARSDLYSLGASAYVIATGQTPYDASSAAAVMVKVLTEPPRPIKKFNPNLSPGFIGLVEKMMAKDAAKRFADAQQVIDAIERVRHGKFKVATDHHQKVPAKAVIAHQPSRIRLMLYGAGAAVVALILIGILRGKGKQAEAQSNNDTRTNETQAVAAQNPADVKTNTVTAAPPPTPDNKTAAVQPKPDPKKEDPEDAQHVANMREWRNFQLRNNLDNLQNPGPLIEKLEEFLRQHPSRRLADNHVNPMLKRAKDAQEKLEKDWHDTKDTYDAEMKANHRPQAFGALMKFEEAHEGSKEAEQALKLMNAMIPDLRKFTDGFAEKGQYDIAEKILEGSIKKMPAEITPPLKEDLERIKAEHQKAKLYAEQDTRNFGQLTERAAEKAREIDPSGKRYDFDEAAKYLREGVSQLHGSAMKKDAGAIADVYARAADMMRRMRQQLETNKSVDLQSLGGFKDGQLVGWDDKRGLDYKPAGLPGPAQTVTWRNITGDTLIVIARALKMEKTTPADLFDFGALAFASGATAIASDKLQQVVASENSFKATAEVALKQLKPAGSAPVADRDSAAKKIFDDAVAAKAKKDGDAALKAQQTLVREYSDTKFVQSHLKEIDDLRLGAAAADESSTQKKTLAEKREEPKKIEPENKKDDANSELKKLFGWSEVKGSWTQDPKRKTSFAVSGGGELHSQVTEGAVQCGFQLDENSTIGIYVRAEADNFISRKLRESLENLNIVTGRGYGVLATNADAVIFADKTPSSGTKPKVERATVPMKIQGLPLQPGFHTVTVAAYGDKLEVTLDGRKWNTNDKLRADGDITIVIEGSAKLESPQVRR